MIADAKVKEARRLLAEGSYSQRQIARLVGISRASVGAIAAGTRPDYESMRKYRASQRKPLSGPLERCPNCGAKVFTPCLGCQVRLFKAEQLGAARASRLSREILCLRLTAIPQRAEGCVPEMTHGQKSARSKKAG